MRAAANALTGLLRLQHGSTRCARRRPRCVRLVDEGFRANCVFYDNALNDALLVEALKACEVGQVGGQKWSRSTITYDRRRCSSIASYDLLMELNGIMLQPGWSTSSSSITHRSLGVGVAQRPRPS